MKEVVSSETSVVEAVSSRIVDRESVRGVVKLFKTKVVFLGLPFHCEYLIDGFPLVEIGFVTEFNLFFPNRDKPDKPFRVSGPHVVKRKRNIYDSNTGLVQYLEMESV